MNAIKPGDRVEVVAPWSSFRGMRGTVTAVRPFLMVVIGNDPRPMRIEESAIFVVTEAAPNERGVRDGLGQA